MVLDPFCGCGTTVAAAEKLRRSWIGIDITYLAIALIEQRLHDHYPSIQYEEHGSPKDISGQKLCSMRASRSTRTLARRDLPRQWLRFGPSSMRRVARERWPRRPEAR